MLVRGAIAGVVVVSLASCAVGNMSSAFRPSPTPSASASATATALPLPNGYNRIADRAGLVTFGAPGEWTHAFLDGRDPALAVLESGDRRTALFWRDLADQTGDGAVVAAVGPTLYDAVLVSERYVGSRYTDPARLERALRPAIARDGTIRAVDRITVDGRTGVRFRFVVSRDGESAGHVIDAFDIDGALVSFAFAGSTATIAAITATIRFGRG